MERYVARSGFAGYFSGESGPLRMLSGKKWNFLEKVDFSACSSLVRGLFPGKI